MPRKPREVLLREPKKYKATRKKKPAKPKKEEAKSAAVYKKASNGRGYKIVDNKVRFVSAKEFAANSK